jgi:hypothetical protein
VLLAMQPWGGHCMAAMDSLLACLRQASHALAAVAGNAVHSIDAEPEVSDEDHTR